MFYLGAVLFAVGAVCFGLDPSVVTTRKSRMTYGVGVLNKFIPGEHPESKKFEKDGVEWCTDIFDALVRTDDSVAIGDTVVRRYALATESPDVKIIDLYASERAEVRYVTEADVKRCGTLRLEKSKRKRKISKEQEVQVRMTFGDTEIKVVVIDVATGEQVKSAIDFLNK